jgi:hypothetical protein
LKARYFGRPVFQLVSEVNSIPQENRRYGGIAFPGWDEEPREKATVTSSAELSHVAMPSTPAADPER